MHFVKKWTARTFRSSICISLSGLPVRNGPQSPSPALLIKISMFLSASCCQICLQVSRLVRSAAMISHSVGSFLARFSSRFFLRAIRIRGYPCLARFLANAAPIPELAPVITAYFFIIPPYFCSCPVSILQNSRISFITSFTHQIKWSNAPAS